MMGKAHVLTGVLAAVVWAQQISATWADLAVGAIAVTGASLVPDIDCGSSTVSNTFGPVSRALSWMTRKATGGHRRGTHSIGGTAILALVVQTALDHRGTWWSIAVLTVVLSLCMAGPLRLLRIRGWVDDVAPVPIACAAAWWEAVPLRLVPAALVIGVSVHVLGDMITKRGCPVLWPLSRKSYRLARLKAGGPTERWVLTPVFWVSIPVAACWTWIDPWWVELVSQIRPTP